MSEKDSNSSNEVSENPEQINSIEANLNQIQDTLKKQNTLEPSNKSNGNSNEQINIDYLTVKADLEKALSDLNKLKKQSGADLIPDVASQERQISDLQAQIRVLQAEKSSVEEKYEQLLGKLSAIRNLGERFKAQSEELSRSKEELKSAIDGKKKGEDSIELLKSELIKLKDEKEETVNKLNEDLSQSASALKIANTSIETLKSDLIKVNKENDTLSTELKSSNSKVNTLESAIFELKQLMKKRDQEYEKNLLYTKDLESSLIEERALKTSLEIQVQQFEESDGIANKSSEHLQKELDDLKENYEAMKQELKKARDDSTINLLNDQIADLKQRLSQGKEEINKDTTKIKEFEAQTAEIAELKKELKEKSLQIGKLRHDTISLQENLSKSMRELLKLSQSDTVDRPVISNMLLTFLSLPRTDTKRFEILQLISHILDWDDDQRVQAGLARKGFENTPITSAGPSTPVRRSFTGMRFFGSEGSPGPA